ncbi:MAG: hypothetical protein AAB582_01430 [Patescibacteria group bacterium]
MEPLARLFQNPVRLKLLRLFLFNDDMAFSTAEAAFRTKSAKDATRREISVLIAADVVRKKTGRAGGTAANKKFLHYDALKAFLRETTEVREVDMLEKLKKGGSLKLVTLSGLFSGAIESKLDLLIVGDKLDDKKLAGAVHGLEAELGRELRYAAFSTEEFKYRRGVYDRLLRDTFDYPNRTILDRLGVTNTA